MAVSLPQHVDVEKSIALATFSLPLASNFIEWSRSPRHTCSAFRFDTGHHPQAAMADCILLFQAAQSNNE
jgi:hypothetical protein